MANDIKCPKCEYIFPMDQSIRDEVQQEFRQKWVDAEKTKEAERKKRELEFQKEIEDLQKNLGNQEEITAKKIIAGVAAKEQEIRKKVQDESLAELTILKEKATESDIQLRQLKEKEVEVLRLQNQMQEIQRNNQIEKEKYLQENKQRIVEEIQIQERSKLELAKKEWEIQRDQQNKLIDDLKRKAEQNSMQLQGEAQELLLEEILTNAFPHDTVGEVPKGKKGADCLLYVKNKFGLDCGKILFESKRTSKWGNDWIEKLKQDAVNCNADIAVLVSQTLPEKMQDKFEIKDGIWICGFDDAKLLTTTLREGIIKVYTVTKSQDNKGDKMQVLYDYLTSQEFASQWKNIRDVFKNMQASIQKERDAMERLWKSREKQLDRALLNSTHIMGAIEGIAGQNSFDFNLLLEDDDSLD